MTESAGDQAPFEDDFIVEEYGEALLLFGHSHLTIGEVRAKIRAYRREFEAAGVGNRPGWVKRLDPDLAVPNPYDVAEEL